MLRNENGRLVGTLDDLTEEILAMTVNKHRVEHGPCSNCGIPTDITLISLCDVCASMLSAVCKPWFHQAQAEFVAENEKRRKRKLELMSGRD